MYWFVAVCLLQVKVLKHLRKHLRTVDWGDRQCVSLRLSADLRFILCFPASGSRRTIFLQARFGKASLRGGRSHLCVQACPHAHWLCNYAFCIHSLSACALLSGQTWCRLLSVACKRQLETLVACLAPTLSLFLYGDLSGTFFRSSW